jgi:hypothetical protein
VKWRKQGILIPPPNDLPWSFSHAAVPYADTDGDRLDVYFTTRDERQRSHIAQARVDLGDRRVDVAPEPVLEPGPLGAFDDSGAMMSCLVREGDSLYLYYQGWSLGVTVPFYVFVGCAIRDGDDAPFVRVADSPVLGRHPVDPYMCASPWVIREDGRWRMWYVSNVGWRKPGWGSPHYVVHIKYAESRDGIEWERDGHVCVDFCSPEEYAISRPCVVKDGDLYRMWYSHRGAAYRIGYAESADGLTWDRMDGAAGIDVSAQGWDSEMVEYPCVFDFAGERHMLYNGNDFGRAGAGWAVLEAA